jgi:hypothetical protein
MHRFEEQVDRRYQAGGGEHLLDDMDELKGQQPSGFRS